MLLKWCLLKCFIVLWISCIEHSSFCLSKLIHLPWHLKQNSLNMLIKIQVCYWGSYCCLINFLLTGCAFWNVFSAMILLLPQYHFGFKLTHILKMALLCLMILTKLIPLHSAMPAMQSQEWEQIILFSFVHSMKGH